MKHLTVLILFISLTVSAQKKLALKYYRDKMTDQEAIVPNHNLKIGDKDINFEIIINVLKNKDKLYYNAMLVNCNGFNRIDNAEIIILFKDQTKISLYNKNTSLRHGLVLMDCSTDTFNTLNKPIEAIRLTNLSNGIKYTQDLKSDFESNYFKDMIDLINNKKYITVE
jgi:hypothetical protein